MAELEYLRDIGYPFIMQRLNREMGKTIVMVTHDRRAAEHAKAIMQLEKGELSERVELRHG